MKQLLGGQELWLRELPQSLTWDWTLKRVSSPFCTCSLLSGTLGCKAGL